MNSNVKMSVIGLGLLSFLNVIFSGIGTKYLPDDFSIFLKNNDAEQIQSVRGDINLQGKVPYLKKLPVLDNNLFIEQNYTELILGGVNFKQLKFIKPLQFMLMNIFGYVILKRSVMLYRHVRPRNVFAKLTFQHLQVKTTLLTLSGPVICGAVVKRPVRILNSQVLIN